jgi:hypothetical protein
LKKVISDPVDIPRDVLIFMSHRWAANLRPARRKFVEAGLAGKSFTERAPDIPLGRLNYSFDSEGNLRWDFDSEKDTGECLISYTSWKEAYRSLADEDYDYWKAYDEGIFRLGRGQDEILKMAPLMQDMARAFVKAIDETEKEFNIELPKYPSKKAKAQIKKQIKRPADIPPKVLRYILEHWAEGMKLMKDRFVEAGLAGKSFTEKAPDLPLGILNYSIAPDGTWRFDFHSKKQTGEIVMTYVDFESGYRALADKNYDSMKAFQEGLFKIEPFEDEVLKMAPLMPDMIEAFVKAVKDAEEKFNMILPTY